MDKNVLNDDVISTAILKASTPQAVLHICQRLRQMGHAAWVVGGCVRDQLLAALHSETPNRPPGDWDIATSARPDVVMRAFPRVVPTGLEHGTVTVILKGTGYEVTTFRAEAEYQDGRRPVGVRFLDDIAADLARRDFTVNAIAYDPMSDTLADPFEGIADLRRGVLRAVGDATARFSEDGLRVLRAARFVAALGFELEPSTADGIVPSLSSYRKVSAERVRDEWTKTLSAPLPSRGFEVMKRYGMLAITAPELTTLWSTTSAGQTESKWEHAMQRVDICRASTTLRLAALFHDVGEGTALVLTKRLRFSNAEVTRVTELVRHREIPYDGTWSDAQVRRWLQRITPSLVDDLCALAQAHAAVTCGERAEQECTTALHELEARARRLLSEGAAMSTKDLAVTGKDVMQELGLAPGPRVGELLGRLLEVVTEEPALNNRQALLAEAHKANERA